MLSEYLQHLRTGVITKALDLLSERQRQILAWRALQTSSATSVVVYRDGLTWHLPLSEGIVGLSMLINGEWEAESLKGLLAWSARYSPLGPDKLLVDVGANIGTTSIPVASHLRCRVVAIEPVPSTFETLCLNVRANKLDHLVTPIHGAVLAQASTIAMMVDDTNRGGSYVARASAHTPAANVEARPLDDILTFLEIAPQHVGLVWADVEGCETDVIASGTSLWREGIPLFAEINPGAQKMQQGIDAFVRAVHTHFDRFLPEERLPDSPPEEFWPIERFAAHVRTIRDDVGRNVLLLPPGFAASR